MAQTHLSIHVSRRWHFWPMLVCIVGLGKLGILRDQRRAAKWLVDHAMRLEVR